MNYKKIIRNSFSQVVPMTDDDSFRNSIIERKNKMSDRKTVKFRKPVIAICAAAAALSLGITGAAAAGIFDFNEIFGSRIRVENEELGSSLIGNAGNIKWSVSDDDYVVNLKGVTGSRENLITIIEIARADGTPVEDYFENTDLLAKTNLTSCTEVIKIDGDYTNGKAGAGYDTYVNEKGNIEMSIELSGIYQDYEIADRTVLIEGMGFYPAHNLIEGEVPREKTAFMAYGDDEYQLTQEEQDYLDSIAVLDLEWSLEFVYNPSEKSADKLTVKDLSRIAMVSSDIDKMTENPDGTYSYEDIGECELETVFDEISISSIGGKLSGKMDVRDGLTENTCYVGLVERRGTKVELIRKDGTVSDVMVLVTSGTSNSNRETGMLNFCFEIEFHANGGQTAVDLSEIGGISINGTIYELS